MNARRRLAEPPNPDAIVPNAVKMRDYPGRWHCRLHGEFVSTTGVCAGIGCNPPHEKDTAA